jgi:hypothetical protein
MIVLYIDKKVANKTHKSLEEISKLFKKSEYYKEYLSNNDLLLRDSLKSFIGNKDGLHSNTDDFNEIYEFMFSSIRN